MVREHSHVVFPYLDVHDLDIVKGFIIPSRDYFLGEDCLKRLGFTV